MLIHLVSAAVAAATPELKVAVTGLQGVGVSEQVLAFYTEHLADQLSQRRVSVVTQREIGALLGVERQQQLAGCGDESRCIAEIANALGVDAILIGDLGHVADQYQLNLKILSAHDGKRLVTHTARIARESALLDEMDRAAAVLSAGLAPPAAGPVVAKRSWLPPARAWVPAVGGAACLIAGGVLGAMSAERYRLLAGSGSIETRTAMGYRDSGKGLQIAADIMFSAGIVAIAVGVIVYLLSPDEVAR